MYRRLRVHHTDSRDMAFVLACLRFGVITHDEFKAWVRWAQKQEETPPHYFELLTAAWDHPEFDAPDVARIIPEDLGNARRIIAFVGIGYARHFDDANFSKCLLQLCLPDIPDLVEKLIRLFPMIAFDALLVQEDACVAPITEEISVS